MIEVRLTEIIKTRAEREKLGTLVAACWANPRKKTCTPMVTRKNISYKPQSCKSPRKASQELAGSDANMALPEVQTKLARFWNENYFRIWPTFKRFPTFCLAHWNGHICLLPPYADITLLIPQPPSTRSNRIRFRFVVLLGSWAPTALGPEQRVCKILHCVQRTATTAFGKPCSTSLETKYGNLLLSPAAQDGRLLTKGIVYLELRSCITTQRPGEESKAVSVFQVAPRRASLSCRPHS